MHSPGPHPPDFSVIVACFNESATIGEFHRRLGAALDGLPDTIEILYVNDGSRDGTMEQLRGIFEADARVAAVIDLAANAGQNNAQSAGIARAAGRDLIFMDCDLQTDPADLAPMIAAFRSGCDMASGRRVRRRDPALRRAVSYLGNQIVSRILNLPLRDLGSGLKIIDGDLVRAFDIGPYHPLDPGAIMLCLRSVTEVPVSHHPRRDGRSRWTPRRALILYHNVLMNLAPVVYPFLLAMVTLVLLGLLGALAAAWRVPGIFPMAREPLFVTTLVTLHILLSVVLLWLIGEFTLRGRHAAKAPAYVVRRQWSRTAAPVPPKESLP